MAFKRQTAERAGRVSDFTGSGFRHVQHPDNQRSAVWRAYWTHGIGIGDDQQILSEPDDFACMDIDGEHIHGNGVFFIAVQIAFADHMCIIRRKAGVQKMTAAAGDPTRFPGAVRGNYKQVHDAGTLETESVKLIAEILRGDRIQGMVPVIPHGRHVCRRGACGAIIGGQGCKHQPVPVR